MALPFIVHAAAIARASSMTILRCKVERYCSWAYLYYTGSTRQAGGNHGSCDITPGVACKAEAVAEFVMGCDGTLFLASIPDIRRL